MSAAKVITAMLEERSERATICPSEAERRLAGSSGDWRAEMDRVHHAARELSATGSIIISWKGEPRSVDDGPYRIGKAR